MRPKCRSLGRDVLLVLLGFVSCLVLLHSFYGVQSSDCAPQKVAREYSHESVDVSKENKETLKDDLSLTVKATIGTTNDPVRRSTASIPKNTKRPKYVKDEFHLRDPLFVGVVTAVDFLDSRAMAVNNTWAWNAPKVEYFAALEPGRTHSLPVISLPGVDDTYPPQKKVYRMLRYMHDTYIDKYNWFMRADDDAYVRIPRLIKFLSQFDPSAELYIGSPGFGRENDLERIKLFKHEHYCMGGPGVIFSRGLLIKLVPHLEDCLKNVVVSWNEDLEVGRCISRRLNIQCTWAHEVCLF